MHQKSEVGIVSIFGRGNWLAYELAHAGFRVELIDVSNTMGNWTPEDWEGPFGFFRSESLTASQVARVVEDATQYPVDHGFSLWLNDGPLELKSLMTEMQMQRRGLSSSVKNYIAHYRDVSQKLKINQLRESFFDLPFQQSWLAHLAHQLTSNVFLENTQGLEYGDPAALFSPMVMRRPTRKSLDDSLNWCREHGVTVHASSNVQDIAVQGKTILGVEVAGPSLSGMVSADNWVWCLTSEETQRLGPKVLNQLYPQGVLKPSLIWMRYRFKLSKNAVTDALPLSMLMLQNHRLPWSHANLSIVTKTELTEDFDVWVRVPNQYRFQKSFIESTRDDLTAQFKLRLPETDVYCSELPKDFTYTYDDLGPVRFPVYAWGELLKHNHNYFENVDMDGPERWHALDWVGQFDYQNHIYRQVEQKITAHRLFLEQQQKKQKEASL